MDAIDMKTFGLMAAIGKIELDNFRERASMGKRGGGQTGANTNQPGAVWIHDSRRRHAPGEPGEGAGRAAHLPSLHP